MHFRLMRSHICFLCEMFTTSGALERLDTTVQLQMILQVAELGEEPVAVKAFQCLHP